MLHVLKHKVQATRHPGGDEALQFNNIGVVEPPEDEYLPGHELDALGLEVVEQNLLKRHDAAGEGVPGPVHVAVSARPYLIRVTNRLSAVHY